MRDGMGLAVTDPVGAILADIEGEGQQGEITLSPTVWRFVCSDVTVPICQGPRGEGKTVSGVSRILRVASLNPPAQPLKGIVIRDTWVNLERSLDLETPVLTPSGWVKAADVAVGDALIAADGFATCVVGVYPQPPQLLWRVKFSDGVSARVTGDHLWAVRGRWDRESPGLRNRRCRRGGRLPAPEGLRIVTTDALRAILGTTRRRQPAWEIPLVGPVRFPSRPVPLDPYLLGVLLGDGGFTRSSISLSTADPFIASIVRERLPEGIRLAHIARYDYRLSGPRRGGRKNPVLEAIRGLGLAGLRSPDKFIPDLYLWNDPETRLQVLRGLMDTDGSATAEHYACFTSTSERLVEGVEFLVRSLGGITRRSAPRLSKSHPYRGLSITAKYSCFRVTIQMPRGMNPFSLPRKADRLTDRRRVPHRFVVGVEPDGFGPAVCFRVDHPSHLFVIQDFILTHNTVIETLLEGMGRGWWDAEFHEGGSEVVLNGGVAKLWCLGMDRPQDANKLQGLAAALGWIEEPAPAADLSSGVPVDVYGLLWSSIRQSGFPRSVQLTMNPPDSDHWTQKLTSTENLSVERFEIPPGENRHLPAGYREQMREALIQSGRGDLVSRLVEGKVGDVVVGEAVINNFSRLQHVADGPLPIFPQLEIVRAWDSGTPNLHPAVVWMQPGPFGLNILGSRVATNLGTQEFIEDEVIPFQRRYFPAEATPIRSATGFQKALHRAWRWRNIGDRSCLTPEGTSSERTVALVIQNMLGGGFEPGPQDWDRVRQALLALFLKAGKGDRKRFVQVDPTENEILIRGLGGRFHFPKDLATGRIQGTWTAAKRVSGLYCVDEATEMLTPKGWLRHEEVKEGDLTYGWRNGHLVEETLQGVHRFPGPVNVLTWTSESLSMVLTPEHRCVVRRRKTTRYGRKVGPSYYADATQRAAHALQSNDYIVRTGSIVQRPTLSDDLVRASAWICAEGHYKDGEAITVVQSERANAAYVAELEALFARLGGKRYRTIGDHGMVTWSLRGNVAALIRLLLPEKVPGPELWRRLSPHQARLFLYEMARGDGHWANLPDQPLPPPPTRFSPSLHNFFHSSTVRIWQQRKEVREALHVIATLGGLPARACSQDAQGRWGLSLSAHRHVSCADRTNRSEAVVPMVWCPELPAGAWVARRRGTIFVTGNSHPVDALGYAVSVLYPPEQWVRKPPLPSRPERVPGGWLGR